MNLHILEHKAVVCVSFCGSAMFKKEKKKRLLEQRARSSQNSKAHSLNPGRTELAGEIAFK